MGVVPDVVRYAGAAEATFLNVREYSLLKGFLATMLGVRDGAGDVDVADRPVLLRCFFLRRPRNPILFEWEDEWWTGRGKGESSMYGMVTFLFEVCCAELVNQICFPLLSGSGHVVHL